ncbi:MAG TPA: 16S rRNA (guanine(966)-N(2))-methyltransferase RsmD [Polyangiales bacterium]|nr:16S rRNA (guanine(966)-N(2))-methyltransferase RsmD [Polyangiales bacterium]
MGGALRGRRLESPRGSDTRPTSERVREALASALQARGLLLDARVLDVFAGTGALGLEALSRGAAALVAVDVDRSALACLRSNVAALELGARAHVLPLDLTAKRGALERGLMRTAVPPFTLVFADPPYALAAEAVRLLSDLRGAKLLAEGAIVALEHARRTPPELAEGFTLLARYDYGDTSVQLWETVAPPEES